MTRSFRIFVGVAGVLVAGLTVAGFHVRHPVLAGTTMGTRYHIAVRGWISRPKLAELVDRIGTELEAIDRQMSTWNPQSEISRFNALTTTNPVVVSEPFAKVVRQALLLAESTGGAFDPTLMPLINLWGFGHGGDPVAGQIPTEADIAAAQRSTGWMRVCVDAQTPALRKTVPSLSLDLGAIAKGYGVDAVARVLDEAGLENWFVEIGGEVVVRGENPNGAPWRIGIQYPTRNPADADRLQGIVQPKQGAIATSGDYRNYRILNGMLYSHLLDPRTGRAVLSDTASVTVLAPSCVEADGVATALFVLGPEAGLAWVERHSSVEALFLVRGSDGEMLERFSSGFIDATGYIHAH